MMIFPVRSTVRNWNTLINARQPLSVDEYPIFRFIANKFVNEIHKLNSIIINKCHKYENRYILCTYFFSSDYFPTFLSQLTVGKMWKMKITTTQL